MVGVVLHKLRSVKMTLPKERAANDFNNTEACLSLLLMTQTILEMPLEDGACKGVVHLKQL